MSNIVAGTSQQMAGVCDCPGVLGGVIELLSGDVWEVQKEANFVVSNIATASNCECSRTIFLRVWFCHRHQPRAAFVSGASACAWCVL